MNTNRDRPAHDRLLLVKSHALRCNGCKRWLGRLPQWTNAELGEWQCDDCGCTSVTVNDGRPFGPRHRDWKSLVQEFAEFERLGMLNDPMITESVVLMS